MSDDRNFYALSTAPIASPSGAELDVESTRSWLADVRGLKLRRAVPQLIVRLDRLSRVEMPATTRLAVLRELKRPLLKAAAGLPKPIGAEHRRDPGDPQVLLLEQRLYCLMVRNLKQVLRDLGFSKKAFGEGAQRRRRWVLRNLFRFLARQIELSLFWERHLPPHTWQELHDLHCYVTARSDAGFGGTPRRGRIGGDFDPHFEYRRLLLLGLEKRLVKEWPRSSFVRQGFESWVAETTLENPDSFIGAFNLYVVKTSMDAPPKQIEGALTESFRGWVLVPANGFLGYVAAVRQDSLDAEPTFTMRSASAMS